jgi:protein-disulfide isomerase
VGATGTPTFYVNGDQLVGAKPFADFKTKIDAALAEKKK